MKNEIKHIRGTGRELVYNFIVDFIKKNKYSPSVREICAGTGLSSTATVYSHLKTLEILGKIERKRGTARVINVRDFQFVKKEESV